MSFFYRAFRYITRKTGRSILLFLTLLATSTLILSGIAVKDATQTAQLNVRQALGGVFTMEQNTSDPSKWQSREVGGFGYQSWYTGEQLTETLADLVLEKVEGIRGYNASAVIYIVAADSKGKTLELIQSEDDGLSALLSSYGDFNSTVSTYASTNTEFDSYFTGGLLELTEGRHINSKNDESAVIISEELAELNGLKVGDKLILHISEFKASMSNIDFEKTKKEVEIVGLFHATAKSSAALSNWSMDNAIYTTMNVAAHVRPDTLDEGYEKICFYVSDPAELESIAEKVKKLPDIDPSDFIIKCDSSSVDSVSKPLSNMNDLISVLIVSVLAVGAVILYLILSARVKERVHESGILLSLGFSKGNIVGQYLTEAIVIAAAAFLLSVFASGAVAKAAGDRLIEYTMSESSDSAGGSDKLGTNVDGGVIVGSDDFAPKFEGNGKLTEIEVCIKPEAVAILFAAGLSVVVVSVIAAALPVLMMKPKEILSKMS